METRPVKVPIQEGAVLGAALFQVGFMNRNESFQNGSILDNRSLKKNKTKPGFEIR